MKTVKTAFKTAFLQYWGTYSNQTFVAVGMRLPEICAAMKRAKVRKNLIERFHTKHSKEPSHFDADGWVYRDGGKTVLWLSAWKPNNLEHLSTLVHETNHMVIMCLAHIKGMGDELDALAYQQEFLFSQIANKLNRRYHDSRRSGKKRVQGRAGRRRNPKAARKKVRRTVRP